MRTKVIEYKTHIAGIRILCRMLVCNYDGKTYSDGYQSQRRDKRGSDWTHAIGHDGCGYANWTVSHHDGINPKHATVDARFNQRPTEKQLAALFSPLTTK